MICALIFLCVSHCCSAATVNVLTNVVIIGLNCSNVILSVLI